MEVIIQTRFSYFGLSAWKSPASTDREKLFAPSRMESRFFYFENITLPSLAAQVDDNFWLHILSSEYLPEHYKQRLIDVTHVALGSDRVMITFEDNRKAGRYFRKYAVTQFGANTVVAQTVLDDDDALADRFVATHHQQMSRLAKQIPEAQGYLAVSYPKGLSMALNLDPEDWFLPMSVPFINLGLTWLGPAATPKNAFLTKHLQIPANHPSVQINTATPMYIRTVHSTNDSDAAISTRHSDNAVSRNLVEHEFSWLSQNHQNTLLATQRALDPERRIAYFEELQLRGNNRV